MPTKIHNILWSGLSLAVGILLWEGLAATGWHPMTKIPPPSQFVPQVLSNERIGIGTDAPTIFESVLATIVRVFGGAAIGFASAFALGLAIGFSPWLKRFAMPWLRLYAPIAPVAWVSLVLALFGIGNFSAFLIVVLGVFFMVTIATVKAIEATPDTLTLSAQAMGLSQWQLRRWIIIPHIMPAVFTTFRLGMFAAWMAILAGEMVGLRNGLGYVILYARNVYRYDILMMGIALIGVSGALLDYVMHSIQTKYLWWQNK